MQNIVRFQINCKNMDRAWTNYDWGHPNEWYSSPFVSS
jgi:hypothetical protein